MTVVEESAVAAPPLRDLVLHELGGVEEELARGRFDGLAALFGTEGLGDLDDWNVQLPLSRPDEIEVQVLRDRREEAPPSLIVRIAISTRWWYGMSRGWRTALMLELAFDAANGLAGRPRMKRREVRRLTADWVLECDRATGLWHRVARARAGGSLT